MTPTTPKPTRVIDVPSILTQHAKGLSIYFDELRQSLAPAPARLVEAMLYSLSASGKRLRPALIIECALAVQPFAIVDTKFFSEIKTIRPETQVFRSIAASMAAMELIHTFSLVHDDLPAMDDDDFRRGKPTNHKVYGEAMAILAGDAMMTLAFEQIATHAQPGIVPDLVRELAHAAGPCGMIGGQVLDIDNENRKLDLPELQQIHRMKTGALLTTSCRLGAICARATETQLDDLTAYGRHLGLAFQIVDDILDETSTPEQLGKATQKDRGKGKNTYPSLLGLDGARDEATRQLNLALGALDRFGDRAERLRGIARFVVERQT